MADMLQRGAEWMSGKLKAHASRTVEYRRGEVTVNLQATVGSTLLKTTDKLGHTRTERTERDYVLAVADLVAGGIAMPPAREDRISDGAELYIALPPAGTKVPVYRYCDGSHTRVRVHTKHQGEAS